jgi:hypothetical protein
MSLRRWLLCLLTVACSAQPTESPALSDADSLAIELTGREFLSVSPEAVTLAPGRQSWLLVGTAIQTSASSLTTVAPKVTLASSDASVASVILDSVGIGRIIGRRSGTATITVRSLRAGNVTKTIAVVVKDAPVGSEEGLVYSALATMRPTSGTAYESILLGPSQLDVRVVIANPTSSQRDFWLSGCGAWVRLYLTADRSGPPVVDIPRGVQCMAADRHVTLPPGAADTVSAGLRLDVPGDSLENRRYYVVAALDRIRDLVEVPAGPVDLVSPIAGLVFDATMSVSDGQLHVHATMTNSNLAPVRLEFGACIVELLAYRTSDRSGKPVWNSSYRRPYGLPDAIYGCPLVLYMGVIKPGEMLSPSALNPQFPVMEMLGDSLPNARYYFRANVGMNGRVTTVDAGDATVTR